jgi:hypothetical protein
MATQLQSTGFNHRMKSAFGRYETIVRPLEEFCILPRQDFRSALIDNNAFALAVSSRSSNFADAEKHPLAYRSNII